VWFFRPAGGTLLIREGESTDMFRRLVVPLDGSSIAERAVPYAIRLAQSGRGQLMLMRAALAPPPRTIDGFDWEREQELAVAEAQAYLDEMAESVSGQVSVETTAPYGRAPARILQTARDFQADAIVMATHGRTGVRHLLYGSVTEAVLASSIIPVLVIHARPGEAPAASFTPYSARILVPQDGSANDAAALHAALEVVGQHGEIVLTTVVTPPDHLQRDESGNVLAYLDQQEESRRQDARDYLNGLAHDVRGGAQSVSVIVDVRIGDAAGGITMAAVDRGVDLVVMATHGRTGIRRALLGSVAGDVLRMAATPVLLVRPHVDEAGAPADRAAVAVHA
jgi:nucleotide-binding universal stress UspA family protein